MTISLQVGEKTVSDWSLTTPGTSSLGSLLAMTLNQGAPSSLKDPMQKLDSEHLESYRRAFDEFDLDGDGKISTQELHLAFRRVGLNPTEGEVQDIINQYDMDGSGNVRVLRSRLKFYWIYI